MTDYLPKWATARLVAIRQALREGDGETAYRLCVTPAPPGAREEDVEQLFLALATHNAVTAADYREGTARGRRQFAAWRNRTIH